MGKIVSWEDIILCFAGNIFFYANLEDVIKENLNAFSASSFYGGYMENAGYERVTESGNIFQVNDRWNGTKNGGYPKKMVEDMFFGFDEGKIYESLVGEAVEKSYGSLIGEDIEKSYGSLVGEDIEKSYGSLIGEEIEKSYGSLIGEEIEKSYGSLIGEDIEKSYGSLVGEDIEKSYGSLIGEDIEKSQGSLVGEEIEKSYGSLVREDIEKSYRSLVGEEIEKSYGSLIGEDIEKSYGSLVGEEIEKSYGSLVGEEIRIINGGLTGEEIEEIYINSLKIEVEKVYESLTENEKIEFERTGDKYEDVVLNPKDFDMRDEEENWVHYVKRLFEQEKYDREKEEINLFSGSSTNAFEVIGGLDVDKSIEEKWEAGEFRKALFSDEGFGENAFAPEEMMREARREKILGELSENGMLFTKMRYVPEYMEEEIYTFYDLADAGSAHGEERIKIRNLMEKSIAEDDYGEGFRGLSYLLGSEADYGKTIYAAPEGGSRFFAESGSDGVTNRLKSYQTQRVLDSVREKKEEIEQRIKFEPIRIEKTVSEIDIDEVTDLLTEKLCDLMSRGADGFYM